MNDIYNRKDEEFTVIGEVPESFKLNDPLYKEGFQAGAASRDADIHRLQMALADTGALELGTSEKCDQLCEQLAEFQQSEFNPDWSLLQASQEALREHMRMVQQLREQVVMLRRTSSDLLVRTGINGEYATKLIEAIAATDPNKD